VQSAVSLTGITVILITFHWSVPEVLIGATLPGLLVRFRRRFAKKFSRGNAGEPPSNAKHLFLDLLRNEWVKWV
jgi:hypothetical protein